MRLPESVVILTGASGGIGLELAEQLCAAGARVLAVSRHMGKLAGLMNRYPDRLRWQTADLRNQEGREQVVARAREMGGVNVLINAAGVNRFALLDQLDEHALDELLDINLKAPLQLTRACLP
ncbi:SDR family NAD(P)-dependent oxidoreductase, partial [Pseudomonas sp.]